MSNNSAAPLFLKRIAAVLAGFFFIAILSTLTDFAMQAAGIFPHLSEPQKFTTNLFLLATAYRLAYSIVGSYLTARVAPDHPMAHALVLGAVGAVLGTVGAVVMWNQGAHWYPITLVVAALPCAWIGAKLQTSR